MKKFLKSEIYGSVNSAQCALIGWKEREKSNFAATVHAQCMNSSRKYHEKKKKEKRQTQTLGFSAQSKRSLSRKNWGL